MKNPKSLKVFELADQLALAVYSATREFPKEELYGMVSQLRRCAVSIPSNIVEGCARHTEADFAHFMTVALGSARELEYQLDLSKRLGFLKDEKVIDSSREVAAAMHAFVKVLRQ